MTFTPFVKENGVPKYTTETVDLQLYMMNWINEWKMIRWVNGWIDEWMDGRTDGRTYRQRNLPRKNKRKDGQLIKQRHTQTYRQISHLVDGQTNM